MNSKAAGGDRGQALKNSPILSAWMLTRLVTWNFASAPVGSSDTPPKPILLPQRKPPTWVRCELCGISASLPRLIAAFAGHEKTSPHGSLMLLCPDCCALICAEIDKTEWRFRTAS